MLTGGEYSTLTGGDYSTLTGGDYSTLTGGYVSMLTGGEYSTLTGGEYSTLTGGHGSALIFLQRCDGVKKISTFLVGDEDIAPGVAYKCVDGKAIKVSEE